MRNALQGCITVLAAILLFSPYARSQTRQQGEAARADAGKTLLDQFSKLGSGGPAPRRDITGYWTGPNNATQPELPPMTLLGQQIFATRKNHAQYSEAESNDPMKSCDPLGFPRSMMYLTRGVAFAQMPNRIIQLTQFNRVWRAIWTDGRELPKSVGGTSADSKDPQWYGYSVGHWDGDYTFVADTVGTDERSWLDQTGHPHSVDMKVQERYTRVDHNTLEMTITVDDPKMYTKPFILGRSTFKWIPNQEIREELCVPSIMQDYLKTIAEPASAPK